jgi:hypothetical protein
MAKTIRSGKIKNTKVLWRVTRVGVRFTVKAGRKPALGPDGKARLFRTRDSAVRLARHLNLR